MLLVLNHVIGVDEDIIEVGRIEVVEIVEKNIVYISLIGRRTIRESKGYNLIFICSIPRTEGSELFGGRVYTDTMKSLSYI